MSDPGTISGGKTTLNSWGPLNKQNNLLCASNQARARRKRKKNATARKRKNEHVEMHHDRRVVKKRKLSVSKQDEEFEGSAVSILPADCTVGDSGPASPSSVEATQSMGPQETKVSKQHLVACGEKMVASLCEQWELDSGFSSEVSPPASGRSSPCVGTSPANLVAMDCEMVGTGPEGRCSELARCSLLSYHGYILYDKYVLPCRPVTDYRTRWSGIKKCHLRQAVPFEEARREILQILEGKVVIGHALHNDFQALDFVPPRHMIRDTSTRLLRHLCGTHDKCSISLKILARKLLNRNIQVGRSGHCSVEDARAALDLYKLVEGQWERDLLPPRAQHTDPAPGPAPEHYMQDQYWPEHMMDCSQ